MSHFSLVLLIFLTSCGIIQTGPGTPPNDAVPPNSTLIAQGSFTGQNNKTVTGTAAVYLDLSGGTYVVRLEGLSAPNETGLVVTAASVSNPTLFSSPLRSPYGSQNYITNVGDTTTKWASISIRSNIQNLNYGTATFPSSR